MVCHLIRYIEIDSDFSRVYDNFKWLYKKVWKLIECTMYICLHYFKPFKWVLTNDKYLEPFNCLQTIVRFVCKQIRSDSLKKDYQRTSDFQIIYIIIWLNGNKWNLVCVKILSTNFRFKNHICIKRIWH